MVLPTHRVEIEAAVGGDQDQRVRPPLDARTQFHDDDVAWVFVQLVDEGALDALRALAGCVRAGTAAFGAHQEDREFHAHITLARAGRRTDRSQAPDARRIAEAAQSITASPAPAWRVDSVALMASELAPGGARYNVRAAVPLAGSPCR